MSDKLRPSEWLIGIGALALLISTFLPWFALPSANEILNLAPSAKLVGAGETGALKLNVWDLGLARWWVYLAILLGISVVLAALLSRTPDWSTILCTPLVVVGLIAFICLLVRLLDPPRAHATAQVGFYLGLVGSITLLGGALWAIRSELVPEGFDKAPRPEFIEVD